MTPLIPSSRKHTDMVGLYVWLSNWAELHPKTLRSAKHGAVALAVVFTMVNAGLFTLQNGRTAPLTMINGKSYGLKPVQEVKDLLQAEHKNAQITVRIADQTVAVNAETAGVRLDADQTLRLLNDRSGWKRIPLVSAVANLFAGPKPVYDVDTLQLMATFRPYITEKVTPAQDASVRIPADTAEPVTIIPEQKGSEFTEETVAADLSENIKAGEFTARLEAHQLMPKWTEFDIRAFMPAIETARKTSLVIGSDEKKVELSSAELAPMLLLATDRSTLKMTLNTELLRRQLETKASTFFVASVAAKTVHKDGTEVSRVEGREGQKLDAAATAELAKQAFEEGVTAVAPAIVPVVPDVLVTRTYSNTDMGLYKKIEDFAQGHKGTYRVAVVQLSGEGNRSAFYNADDSIVTASTYKLFIAYGIMQKIDDGSLSLGSPTPLGTVEECMYQMIHVSSNECGKALQDILGWAAFDKKLKADGFTATQLHNSEGTDKHTTARDEMKLVTKLYNRELLSDASTEYLFDLMKKQIYRKGIPAGSNGAVVADKVGYLDGLYHDIGVVYAPKCTYALVILTDGSAGWDNIRQLSQQVYDFYNQ